MANRLTMAKINAIHTLRKSGHSNRKIAKLLEIDRGTVGKYVAAESQPSAPTGSAAAPGPPSDCQPWSEMILAKLEQGLSAKRIHQDLADDHDCVPSYYSVRRFIAKRQNKTELPVRRIETPAGEEAQVDFGTGAWVIDADGNEAAVGRHKCKFLEA